MSPPLAELIQHRKVLVCCGAGGVGKTTTAAGLALAAARSGRKVLALTVDPSRRLAETLGVESNLPSPVSLPASRLECAGIEPPGELQTWMLDPQRVSDRVVRRFARDPQQAERLMGNRFYRHISRMVAGMQEYTAMEALHGFIQEGRYDLVVLDTPPSRNALAFLDGPRRLQRFFDGRIFRLFTPRDDPSLIRRAASVLIGRVMGAAFGDDNFNEMQEFFVSFKELFSLLSANAVRMRKVMQNPDEVAFLLVTSSAPDAIEDAHFFRRKTDELELPFRAFVLNRSKAYEDGRQLPDEELLGDPPTDMQRSALRKLQGLAELEFAEMRRDQQLLDELREDAGEFATAVALPELPRGAEELSSLVELSDVLMAG